NSGRQLRDALTAAVEKLKNWLQQPWDAGRVVAWFVVTAIGVTLVLLARTLGPRWWRMLARSGGDRRPDPVRRAAARWLERIQNMDTADSPDIVSSLQRLRFGPPTSWAEANAVFGRVRQVRREARGRGRRI